jgi:septal ring-binding cell division protein DamX
VSNDDVIEQALAVARALPGAQVVAVGAGPGAQVDSAASSTAAESPLDRSVPEAGSAQRDGAAGRDSGSLASASSSGPTAARASVAAEVASSRAAAIEQRPIAAASGKREHETLLQWRLAQTREWLRSVSKDRYSIQLLATDTGQRRNLEAFLSRRERGGDIGQIFVYRTRIKTREWYGVLFGEFVSYTQAREALRNLPRELRLHQPFIRNIKDINALG